MPFEMYLKKLVDDMEAKGAILLDWEGESVVHYGLIDDYDLRVMGAYQVIIHNFLKNIDVNDKIKFFQLKFDKIVAQFMPINKDYFIMIMFDNKEIASKALFYLEKTVLLFSKEIG